MSYQGKEVLKIWEFVTEFENWKKDNLYNIPIIGSLAQYNVFGHFMAIVNKIEATDFGKTVKCFLQALHGINRAFNSYTYSDLVLAADKQLNGLSFTKNELSLFNRVKMADSYLDKDFINLQIAEKHISIPEFIFPDFLKDWWESSKEFAENTIIEYNKFIEKLKEQLLSAKGEAADLIRKNIRKLRNKIRILKLTTSLAQTQSVKSFNFVEENLLSRSPLVLVPSVTGTLTTITGLAGFCLTLFGFGSSFVAVTAILKYFVASIVSTFFTSSGAIVSRYMAAALVRLYQTGLPLPDGFYETSPPFGLPGLFQLTGMAGSAWCYLMQFALPVLATSLLIITLIKSKVTIGNHIYIYGDGDSQLSILDDLDENNLVNHAEVHQVLTEGKLQQLSQKSYADYYGFSVNYKNEVVYATNLNTGLLIPNGPQLYSDFFSNDFLFN